MVLSLVEVDLDKRSCVVYLKVDPKILLHVFPAVFLGYLVYHAIH